MTVHVLHAGDGYTYLTQQVASDDITRSSKDPLTAYYQAAGNPPGRWVGSGCADLGVSGEVTEEQMLALFGEGLRPDANEFIAAQIAAGVAFDQALNAARLGRKFYSYANEVPLAAKVQVAYEAFGRVERRRPSVEERRRIKTRAARDMLRAKDPGASAEISGSHALDPGGMHATLNRRGLTALTENIPPIRFHAFVPIHQTHLRHRGRRCSHEWRSNRAHTPGGVARLVPEPSGLVSTRRSDGGPACS